MKHCLGLSCLFLSFFAWGNSASLLLEHKLNQMTTLKANFTQVVYAKKKVISKSRGQFYLSRPGRFRWDVEDPMPQSLIADGKHLWVYDIALEQVTEKEQSKSMEGPAALFLSGKAGTLLNDFANDFEVSVTKKILAHVFDLKAKGDKAAFWNIRLIFNQNALTEMDLMDAIGQKTVIIFTRIQLNPPLSVSLFQFKVPRGVDVIQQ